jgi:hypothetical protein
MAESKLDYCDDLALELAIALSKNEADVTFYFKIFLIKTYKNHHNIMKKLENFYMQSGLK